MFNFFNYCVIWTIKSSSFMCFKRFLKSCSFMFVFMLIIEFISISLFDGFNFTMFCEDVDDIGDMGKTPDLTHLHRALNRECNRLTEANLKWEYCINEFEKVNSNPEAKLPKPVREGRAWVGRPSDVSSHWGYVFEGSNPNLSPEYKMFMGSLVSTHFVECKKIATSINDLENEIARLDSKYKPCRLGPEFRRLANVSLSNNLN